LVLLACNLMNTQRAILRRQQAKPCRASEKNQSESRTISPERGRRK
jgi:hypothetical protein